MVIAVGARGVDLDAGVKVYTGLAGRSVREAVERYKTGALHEATGADVQGR